MTLPTLGGFLPLIPDLVLVIGALSLLVLDLLLPHGDKRLLAGGSAAVLLAALASTWLFDTTGEVWGGAYQGTALALFFKRLFFAGGFLAILGGRQQVIEQFTRRQGEYYLLLLLAVLGMSLVAGARDLVLLVVAFELMSIPLYALAAYAREDRLAVEGALKLLLTGALSSATLLFGVSLLFGLAGDTAVVEVAQHVARSPSPLAALGVVAVLGGMGFKLGVFPFHMWVPDTYQGARTPFVAFLASAPKIAGLAVLMQLLLAAGGALLTVALPIVLALAALTLVAGNFLAIRQENVKRLLAYSGVAHLGFLLAALATGTYLGVTVLLFYAAGYLFTTLGAFLVVHAVATAGGDDSVASFDGLGRRNGWLALAMLIFLLSLGGIPFVVGFWSKLFVFVAAWQAGHGWFVGLGAVLSVLALFYYLRIARAMLMHPPVRGERIEVDLATNVAIGLCVAAVVGFGLAPGPLVVAARVAASSFMGS